MSSLWLPLAAASMALSAVSTAIIVVRLWKMWDLQVSSLRWLFFMFFVSLFVWTSSRFVVYARMSCFTADEIITDAGEKPWRAKEIECLGIHAVVHLRLRSLPWFVATALLGDMALFAVTLWLIPLAYELSRIALKSMDRGAAKERQQIERYKVSVVVLISMFFTAEVTLIILHRGFTRKAHVCLLVSYVLGAMSMLYKVGRLSKVKVRGREQENVHGEFMPSPLYRRLKHIMIVYSAFAFPYQIVATTVIATGTRSLPALRIAGAALIFNNCTGLVMSLVTGCSQILVLRMCRCCLPEDFEAQFLQRQFHLPVTAPPPSPRSEYPVFVCTDIEASSALWATAPLVMQQASELHDSIIRSLLVSHHGIEITTCGDSFELAFNTIQDAVAYCMDAQLRLLVAKWPKALIQQHDATSKQRVCRRLVFQGLRVRMGIHDASESDGPLIRTVHTMTGRMTYTGASEVLVQDVGNLGYGGQVLATQRVAEWLDSNPTSVGFEFSLQVVGPFISPALGVRTMLYDLLPAVLTGRRHVWKAQQRDAERTQSSH